MTIYNVNSNKNIQAKNEKAWTFQARKEMVKKLLGNGHKLGDKRNTFVMARVLSQILFNSCEVYKLERTLGQIFKSFLTSLTLVASKLVLD